MRRGRDKREERKKRKVSEEGLYEGENRKDDKGR
jgi:hypothetical protein